MLEAQSGVTELFIHLSGGQRDTPSVCVMRRRKKAKQERERERESSQNGAVKRTGGEGEKILNRVARVVVMLDMAIDAPKAACRCVSVDFRVT